MTLARILLILVASAAGTAAVAGSAGTAAAQGSATPAQLEEAKKAFLEGKKLFEAKKHQAAADKFLESYKLSKNAVLLYNVALALDEGGQKDPALYYYRKFLADGPADAPQRPDATTRLKALEKELGPDAGKTEPGTKPAGGDGTKPAGGDGTKPAGGDGTKPAGGDGTKPAGGDTKPVTIKPPGTYSATDFQHALVEEVPPGKPIDLTAFVPEDSGWTVTLFYRGAGDDKFTPVAMKWRYKELVGRVPQAKVTGTSIQYYLEVKDQTGAVVTKVAKASSPNVVYLEPAASARFYPDWSDNGPIATGSGDDGGPTSGGGAMGTGRNPDDDNPLGDENPLAGGDDDAPTGRPVVGTTGPGPTGAGDRRDVVGPSPTLKWGATGAAAALMGTSLIFYMRAANAASTLEGEADLSRTEQCASGPPSREFDQFLADVEASGKSSQTMARVTFGLGLVATAAAGYVWWKVMKAKKGKKAEAPATVGRTTGRDPTWVVAPVLTFDPAGANVLGGAASVEF